MEVDRKRPHDGPVPGAKRPTVTASGPVSAEEIELFQKEAIFRQMNAYKRERDELQSQLAAAGSGDEALRSELALLTDKYIAAAKQVERLASPSVARIMNAGKDPVNGDAKASESRGESTAASDAPSEDKSGTTPADPKELLDLRLQLASAEGEVAKLREIVASEDTKRMELDQQISQLEIQLAQSPAVSLSLEAQLKEARAETQRLANETSTLHQQLADLRGSQADYEAQVREKNAAVISSLERRIAAAETDVARIRGARDDLLSEVSVLKAECAEHKNEATRLREAAELAASDTSRDLSEQEPRASDVAGDTTNSKAGDEQLLAMPTDADALRERCMALFRQNKALTDEISGLEQGFARANAKAKAALKATAAAEQKLGVLNTAKVRSDEKYIGAMRSRDALGQELTRNKQALVKSAEVVAEQKALEQRLVAQVARLQKQVAQGELAMRHRQSEIDSLRRAKHEADTLLASARAAQDSLRDQLARRGAEREALATSKRQLQTSSEKLQRQLDTQRAVSGMGSASEVQEQLESLRSIAMCPVCQKNWKDRAITTCGHTLCADCVQSRLAARMRKCPMCNGHFASNDVLTIHL